MKNKTFIMSWDTMQELENFSARYEQLRNFIDFIHDFVWQEIVESCYEEKFDKLGCLTEMLSDVAHIRDNHLESIIKKISPLPDPVRE